jgi:hypothetical protein
MQRSNFEKEIKEVFEKRTIQPSAQAWDRLDAMLDLNSKKKSNSWIYLAASFVGVLLMATIFFSQNNSQINSEEKVVENNISPKKNIIHNSIGKGSSNNEEVITKESIEIVESKVTKKDKKFIEKDLFETNVLVQNKVQDTASKNNERIAIVQVIPPLVIVENTSDIKQNPPSTDIVVDASSLLSQVDGELNLSFRNKVLKNLSTKYQKVKVAVVTRNLQ